LDALLKRVKSYGHIEPLIDDSNAAILKQRKVEHCVQYRETDFNFLSRTLERLGVYYYFKHENDKHTLVLSDKSNYPLCVESEIEYAPSTGGQMNVDRIVAWENGYEFVSGKWEQTDYDFLQPSTSLRVNALKHSTIPLKNNQGYELYDFPNDYFEKGDGKLEALRRMEEEEIRFNSASGASTCKTLTPGYVFRLTEHPNSVSEKGRSYLLTSVVHQASQPGPFSSSGTEPTYSNQFECVPREMQYRPARTSPQPIMSSVQTAMVVGPKGEEIYTDPHGRVKIQFHWDREGKRDENTSCWVRVSQSHAGRGFGGIDIPRVGEEVIVSFIEGDLDRPIITGRVYHKESMPPFALPKEKTRSGIKSKTYKGGGYNEISMDDTPTNEQLRIHAEHNMDSVIKHDQTQIVGNDRTAKVGKNEKKEVGVDKFQKIGSNETKEVGANQSQKVGGNRDRKVSGDESIDIKGAQTVKIGKKQSIDVGETIEIKAGTSITFKCGASTITMNKGGVITISGTIIAVAGAANCSMTAPVTNVTGAVLLTAMGAITRVQGKTLTQVMADKVEVNGTNVAVEASANLMAKGAPILLN
jgi:type VI secretion system secreted protein VgrG